MYNEIIRINPYAQLWYPTPLKSNKVKGIIKNCITYLISRDGKENTRPHNLKITIIEMV